MKDMKCLDLYHLMLWFLHLQVEANIIGNHTVKQIVCVYVLWFFPSLAPSILTLDLPISYSWTEMKNELDLQSFPWTFQSLATTKYLLSIVTSKKFPDYLLVSWDCSWPEEVYVKANKRLWILSLHWGLCKVSVHREGDNLNSIINHFHKVLDEFISVIKIGRLQSITSHKPQNCSVCSWYLYVLRNHGNSQLEDILFWGQRLENVFISSFANQVLEDEQRICTWNQYRETHSVRSCFMIGNGKCKQLSDWSEL